MRFTATLRQKAHAIWEAEKRHPFVRGIGDGSLPREKFRYYMIQDYLFLVDFCRIFALGAAKADDIGQMSQFSRLLHETLHTEMSLHRAYGEQFGIPPAAMEQAEPAPTCLGYTRFMLEAVQRGTVADLAAAVLPCQWGYAEIGRFLKETGDTSANNPYRDWIQMYASEEFKQLGDWLRNLLDSKAAGANATDQARWTGLFLAGSRYEYMFWQMCWEEEQWPVSPAP